jgi:hypothetical protein
MALENLLESLVSGTGKSKNEILDEWKKALSAISPLRKRLDAASDPKELEHLIDDSIKRYDEESDYMMALSTAIERFIVAREKLEVAAAKVDSIEWKRDLISMKESFKNSPSTGAVIERLDNNTRNMYDAVADSWIEVSQRRLRALRYSWRTALVHGSRFPCLMPHSMASWTVKSGFLGREIFVVSDQHPRKYRSRLARRPNSLDHRFCRKWKRLGQRRFLRSSFEICRRRNAKR